MATGKKKEVKFSYEIKDDALVLTSDGKQIVLNDINNIKIFDVISGEIVKEIPYTNLDYSYGKLVISNDNTLAAIVGNSIGIFNLETGTILKELPEPGNSGLFSIDGQSIFVARLNTLTIVNIGSEETTQIFDMKNYSPKR